MVSRDAPLANLQRQREAHSVRPQSAVVQAAMLLLLRPFPAIDHVMCALKIRTNRKKTNTVVLSVVRV